MHPLEETYMIMQDERICRSDIAPFGQRTYIHTFAQNQGK